MTQPMRVVSRDFNTSDQTVAKTRGWYPRPGADWRTHWVDGEAAMGNTPFLMPIITHVRENLWQGGFVPNIDLGDDFAYVISLYPWEKWPTNGERLEYKLYDSHDVDTGGVYDIAAVINERLDTGKPVLVHCQAGLNRSALVTATALMQRGMSADAAIKLLREKRSPAVLCNPTFEAWLRGQPVSL